MIPRHAISLVAALLFPAPASLAQRLTGDEDTIVVTTVEDVVDFAGAQQIADLPGPDGRVSFREACIAANNTTGPQTIAFAIPQSEFWLTSTMAMLKLESGVFLLTDSHTTIDFTTQTAHTGDTNPNGWEVGIYGLQPNGWGSPAIVLGESAHNCIVKGLSTVQQRGDAIAIYSNNNRIIACTISGPIHNAIRIGANYNGPPASNNVIGGTQPGEGNRLSGGNAGIAIYNPADDNVIIGNRISGSSWGVLVLGNQYTGFVNGNRIGGPTDAERNIIADAGSYCCEGAPSGGQVKIDWANGTVVENNWIGLTADGGSGAGQIGPVGIHVQRGEGTVLRNNTVADIHAIGVNHHAGQHFGVGINITGLAMNTIVQGNRVGTDALGVAAIPNFRGVVVGPFIGSEYPEGVLIGGTEPGEGNVIAHSIQVGVRVSSPVTEVTILGNSIFNNGGLGIELASGANGNQAAPVLSSASANGGSTTVEGSLSSAPNALHRIEFFANDVCDGSGFGEGEVILGAHEVMTASDGHATFSATVPTATSAGQQVTATATNLATSNTSEFSACVPVTSQAMPGDVNGDGTVGVADLLAVINAWGACDTACPADVAPPGGDGVVGVADLLMVINNWG